MKAWEHHDLHDQKRNDVLPPVKDRRPSHQAGFKIHLKELRRSQYGGAPLLGLKGLVVKTHGSSKANEVKNSIIQCIAFKEQAISEKIGQCLSPREEDIKEP